MARWTASSAAGLTAVEPFTTRDTVERETPAAAATSSIVAVARGVSMVTGWYLTLDDDGCR